MIRKISVLAISLLILISCDNPSGSGNGSSNGSSNTPAPTDTIETLHYAAIGASDLIGNGQGVFNSDTTYAYTEAPFDTITDSFFIDSSYSYMIKDSLSTYVKNLEYSNLGYLDNVSKTASGFTVDSILKYEVPSAISKEPDLITIWAGGNDFIDILLNEVNPSSQYITIAGFQDGLNSLLTELTTSLPDAMIVLGNLPDMSKLPVITDYLQYLEYSETEIVQVKIKASKIVLNLNNIISTTAAKYDNCYLVDLYSGMNIGSNTDLIYNIDKFHPSEKGYREMANRYMNVINGLFQD